MIEKLVARARNRGRLRARLVHFALDPARAVAGLRETLPDWQTAASPRIAERCEQGVVA